MCQESLPAAARPVGAVAAKGDRAPAAVRDGRLNFLFGWVPHCVENPMGMLELPLCVVLCVAYRAHFSPALLLPLAALYLWKECVPMSVCLHRYFSHKGFRCGRVTQLGLYLLGCLASQGPPLWWASKHRRHHAACDTEDDPHSPVTRSSLYAWLGWVYLPGAEGAFGKGTDVDRIRDHLEFPELAYMENFSWVPVWAVHAMFYHYGGLGYFVFVSLLSGVVCQLATLYFNVIFHEDLEASGACKATDRPADPLANMFGEAHHRWHHIHPRAYHRPGLDLPYWTFISPGLALGIFHGANITHSTSNEKPQKTE